MAKNYFIGAGISSFFCQLMFWKKHDLCFYPNVDSNPFEIIRKNLEINKVLQPKAISKGTSYYHLIDAKLHDRDILGGNSGIWGGLFDTAKVSDTSKLENMGIVLSPLSYPFTGSESNSKSIVQLQEPNGGILNVAKYLKNGMFQYLHSINSKDSILTLNFMSLKSKKIIRCNLDDKIFICIGIIQTIDLLIRSNILKNGDVISLEEFNYNLGFSCLNDAVTISYTPIRAMQHFFGMQNSINFLDKNNTVTVHQNFHSSKSKIQLLINGNEVFVYLESKKVKKFSKFGSSIHYNNMKVNGEKLSSLISRICPNLYFINMGAIEQTTPGPISSDIYSYIENI